MKLSLERTVVAGLAAGLLLLVAVSGISYRAMSELIELGDFRRQASLILIGLGGVETRVNEAETNARGFVLSGDTSYLESYERSVAMVWEEMRDVRNLTAQDSAQRQRLEVLEQRIAARLAQMSETLASRRDEGLEPALERIKTGRGRRLMNEVRALMTEIDDVAERRYAERSVAVEQSAFRAKIIIVFGNLVAIAIVILAARIVRREIAAREKSEARYRDLFEDSHDAIYTNDLAGRLTSFNAAAERMTGYTREEAYRLPAARFLPAEELGNVRERVARGPLTDDDLPGPEKTSEGVILAKDGRHLTLEVRSHVRFDGEHPVEVQSIARDVSERKQLERERVVRTEELEESNRVKTYFAATMAHELKNTFSVLIGFGDLLYDSSSLSDDDRELTKSMRARCWQGLEVIRVTLEMSRSEVAPARAEDLEQIDLDSFLAALQRDTEAPREGVELIWETEPQLPSIQSDPIKLRMVLQNLLANALKFTARGTVRLRADTNDAGVRFSISDTGRGIPADQLETLFNPFQQAHGSLSRRAGGVGLGLFIVARLVKLLEGEIAVESAPGSGTTFTVCVPISRLNAGEGRTVAA